MYRHRSSQRTAHSIRPLVAFLLVASFGILFAGCSKASDDAMEEAGDEFVFTADDLERSAELELSLVDASGAALGQGLLQPLESASGSQKGETGVFDLSMVKTYASIRSPMLGGDNPYRVTNEFLNVRSEPRVTAENVARFVRGDVVDVIDFVDAAWAKVKLPPPGKEGYVATRYIAKMTSEEKLPEEKKKFDGLFFVDFGFVNVRKSPDSQSEKLGELPGQAIVRPMSMDAVWARIPFGGKEGYVAVEYLSPFLPNFLVRQGEYTLPVLHYRLQDEESIGTLASHVARLKQEGMRFLTLADFRDLLLRQEERDVRLEPKSIIILISDVSEKNVQELSDMLVAANVRVTLILKTTDVGMHGITERMILTLVSNGFDIQSGGHTGDDLRSLTNAQITLELKESRTILNTITGRPVFAVAYPEGGVNDRVMQLAADAGYLFGVSDAPGQRVTRDQLLHIPSELVTASTTVEDVVRIAKGG
jgi:peptidoglycan/xylan/chitin deacetylase (PgdA/CDA1 family)